MCTLSGLTRQAGSPCRNALLVVMLLQFRMIHMRGKASGYSVVVFFFSSFSPQQMGNVSHSRGMGQAQGVTYSESYDYVFHRCNAVGGTHRMVVGINAKNGGKGTLKKLIKD